jgi:hypothetical protein
MSSSSEHRMDPASLPEDIYRILSDNTDHVVSEENLEYHRRYYLKHRDVLREKSRLRFRNDPRWFLLRGARHRSRQLGLPFELSVADIVIPEYCPILNVKLVPKTRYTPSLDRLIPSKGYVKTNIWVISKIANQMKSDSTLEEQRKFAEWVKTL